MKTKQLFIAVICVVLVAAVTLFAWNEMQKQSLELTFYGAEISADGTVIQETQFQIKGYLREISNSKLSAYNIYHEPITFKNIPDLIISLEFYQGDDLTVYYIGNANDPNYVFTTFSFNPDYNHFEFPSVYLSSDMRDCIIKVNDTRFIVGSIDPNYRIEKIISSIPEVEIDGKAD